MIATLTKSITTWQREYETGDLEIDGQHQELFDLVKSLHNGVVSKQKFDELEATLNCLADHTIKHFQTEETLMLTADYPDYHRHKQTHDQLINKVENLRQKFSDHNAEITTDITQFLADWLTHHIKGEDQKMIHFFQRNT